MNRCLTCLVVLFSAVTVRGAEFPQQPNIIYIMCDDLGYGDLGCYGQKTIKTPHIDRLASEGMRFTSYYAGCTVCRPSRLSLWTGQHMGHTPINSNAGYVFKPQDVTVAELLKPAGYATGGVGKWAMGAVGNTGHPNKNGFDFWFGYLDQGEAHNYYPEFLWRNDQKVMLKGNKIGPHKRVAVERVTYSHDEMTKAALEFIREHAQQPFLLHVHWTIPHANNEGGRHTGDGMEVPDYGIYKDREWPNPEKGFAAMITRMDGDVGRLIALLKELGIEKKTLVLFTSDNGPHQEGNHKVEYFDSNGTLRGFKRDIYEGGVRVPLIARLPGVIAAGTTSDYPCAFCDFLPTACQLAGAEVKTKTDGISFAPTLLGQKQTPHEYIYYGYQQKRGIRKGNWKIVRNGANQPWELYDLSQDLSEKHDVASEHPEIVEELARYVAEAEKK